MNETEGLVVRVEGSDALVRADRPASCGTCAKGSESCGTASLLGFFERQSPLYRVRNTIGAQAGERVRIGLPQNALLKGASAIYLPALLLLVSGAIAGQLLGGNAAGSEAWSVGGAALGLVLGFFWSRRQSARLNAGGECHPVVLSRINTQSVVNFYGDNQ